MEHVDRIIEAIRTKTRTIPQFFEYDDAPLNEMEWLRYACVPVRDQQVVKEDPKFTASMARALAFAREECVFRLGFLVVPITWGKDGFPVLPFEQKSEKLRNNLEGFQYSGFRYSPAYSRNRQISRNLHGLCR